MRLGRLCFFSGLFVAIFAANSIAQNKPNALVTAMAFAHRHAKPAVLIPAYDTKLKATLLTAVSDKNPTVTFDEVSGLFDQASFDTLAGDTKALSLPRLEELVKADTPSSRNVLFEKTRQHADLLTTQFDLIDEPHQRAANELTAWIAKNYDANKPLHVSVICTGNSRRSILGSTLGNIAAAYYGMPNIRFASGGTTPSAFNSRTINALREISVDVQATGEEAPRGKAGDPNPIYRVTWGEGLSAREFSKTYNHQQNPQKDFAAILVCHEADEACPTVNGAAIRIPAPYFDPKAFDGAPFEAAKYAERRDDIGRFMLCVMMQARRQIADAQRK